jgi:hypothetical protein
MIFADRSNALTPVNFPASFEQLLRCGSREPIAVTVDHQVDPSHLQR